MRVYCWMLASAVLLAGCGRSSGEFFLDLGGNKLEVERGSTGALAVTLLADEAFHDAVTVRAAVTPGTAASSGGLTFVSQTLPADRKVTFKIPIDPAMTAGTEFDAEVVAVSARYRAMAQVRVVVAGAGGALDVRFGDHGWAVFPTLGTEDGICAMAPATAPLTVFATVESGMYMLRAFDGAGRRAANFGTEGLVQTGIHASPAHRCELLRDASGGLLLVGESDDNIPAPLFISRYDSSGALDTTYGSGGIAVPSGAPTDVLIDAVAHPDGGAALLASTLVRVDDLDTTVMVLLRVDRYGTPVMGFGSSGRAVYLDAPIGQDAQVAVAADMQLLVARTNFMDHSDLRLVLERILPDGNRDLSWAGGEGATTVSYGAEFFAPVELLMQPDGKVLVGSNWAGGRFDLRRFWSNGAVDTRFGTDGVVNFPSGGTVAHAQLRGLTLDAIGRLVAGVDHEFSGRLLRLTSDGAFDAAFGLNGEYNLNVSGWGLAGISVLPDGCILVMGHEGPYNHDFAIRILP